MINLDIVQAQALYVVEGLRYCKIMESIWRYHTRGEPGFVASDWLQALYHDVKPSKGLARHYIKKEVLCIPTDIWVKSNNNKNMHDRFGA